MHTETTIDPTRSSEAAAWLQTRAARARTPQRFGDLVSVETRKMVNTRSGRALMAGLVVLAAILLALKLTKAGEGGATFENYTMAVTPSVSYLLPLLGLLAMTSEWTQRTALTTFTLTPRRLRVVGARFLAALGLSSVVLAVTTALTAGATSVAGTISDEGASFAGAGGTVRTTVIAALLQVVMGAAWGALIPQTAVAMGVFIGLPLAWATVAPELAPDMAAWLDVADAYERLGSSRPGTDLPQTLAAVGAWVVLPAVVGVVRSLRREVK